MADNSYNLEIRQAHKNGYYTPEESNRVYATKYDRRTYIVDSEDEKLVGQYNWTITSDGYAKKYLEKLVDGQRVRRVIYMHRLIMGAKKGQIVDHINGDKLDNRRSNLRMATKSLNALNTSKHRNKTGYKGVRLTKRPVNPYTAVIVVNKRQIHLGVFPSPETAGEAYLSKQKELIA